MELILSREKRGGTIQEEGERERRRKVEAPDGANTPNTAVFGNCRGAVREFDFPAIEDALATWGCEGELECFLLSSGCASPL